MTTDLWEARKRIDAVDREMTALFWRRMDISADIAAYKARVGLPVYDPERERAKLMQIGAGAPLGMREYTESLYQTLFALSRAHQRSLQAQKACLSSCGGEIAGECESRRDWGGGSEEGAWPATD